MFRSHEMPAIVWVLLSAILVSLSRLPLYLGWLVFIGWIPLIYALEQQKLKIWQAAAVFSTIYIWVVLYWIVEVTPGGQIGIWIVYFLYYLLCFYVIRRIGNRLPRWRYVGFIAVLISFEFLQNFTEMRFPWFNNAYSLADYTLLIQAAELGGVILLSALILLVNVFLYLSFMRSRKYLFGVLSVFLLWGGFGWFSLSHLTMQKHDTKITIMQPSIPQDDKWDAQFYREILTRYEGLCAQAAKDSTHLMIFPEAAMPVYLMSDWASLARLQGFCRKYHMEIFTGFPHYERAPKGSVNELLFYNAAALFKPDGSISEPYYKNILVPVGERMLWLDYFPILWKLQFGQANWEFGREQRWYQSDSLSFSPSICYELAFAGLHQKMALPKDPKTGRIHKADYLVNITNDAWFGTSYGPWLHAMMAKFRAVENRIQVYRSANTGISLVVDPKGRIIAKAGLFKITNISAPLYTCPRIPLYRHLAWYPWLAVGLAIVLFALSLLVGRQRKQP